MDSLLPAHHHLKGHSRALGASQPGAARLLQGGAGISKLEARGMSAWLCEPGSHQCMKASLYKLHSPRSRPAFPIGHGLAPAAFLG